MLDSVNCLFYIHGDDPVIVNGVDVNQVLANLGRFKEIRRTTGVSTTDLTGKLLRLLEQSEQGEESKSEADSSRVVNPPKQTFL